MKLTQKRGFTLLEMLTVMAIMMIMMTMAMVTFQSFGKGTAMRSGLLNVKTGLMGARQWAVTHRVRTSFTYGNASGLPKRGYYLITNSVQKTIGETNYLPAGVVFTNLPFDGASVVSIMFKLDGTVDAAGTQMNIGVSNEASTVNMVVYPLTGKAKVLE